jgi:KaiC/GvpD/RAD55 family RecA-like ATPase
MVVIMRLTMDGERRRRSIEINKYRRSPHYKGEFPCTITTKGIAIFPLDAPDRPDTEVVERYSSGVAGLDEMTHGGFLRNSIMLVRGPTGSGKTMLAGLYARAGARRGERVVYYGFEEPRPTLIRNFEEVGMGVGQLPLDVCKRRGIEPERQRRAWIRNNTNVFIMPAALVATLLPTGPDGWRCRPSARIRRQRDRKTDLPDAQRDGNRRRITLC